MFQRKAPIYVLSGLFLIFDRFLKWQALHGWSKQVLVNKFFGWEPFLNPGIAFGLPVPWWVTTLFTVPILVLIAWGVKREARTMDSITHNAELTAQVSVIRYELRVMGLVFIFVGALSNLIDRLVYHVTVDFFLVLTGIINVADCLIVVGFLMYSMAGRKNT